MPASAEELVELLSLEVIDTNLFRGRQPDTDRQRVFGGQVAAQALIAGVRTVDPAYRVHSLHSYFLLPGDTAVPIVYDVEQLRDGRSFATRRVVARQHGRPIFYLTASFQRDEQGFEHQDVMPEVAPPEDGLDFAELARSRGGAESDAFVREWAALDVRYIGNSRRGLAEDPDHPAKARLWIRVNGQLSDDPLEHLATFTYASDMTLLGATLVPHGVNISTPWPPARLAGPRRVVPPALPGRRVVALRPALAVRLRRPRAGPGPGVHPGRSAGRDRRAGGADQAARLLIPAAIALHRCSFETDTPGTGYG